MRLEDLFFNNHFDEEDCLIIDDYGSWTVKQLRLRILEFAYSLRNAGVRNNDKVAMVCENGSSFMVALIGISYIGAIAVPLDQQMPLNLINDLIIQSGVNCICISGPCPEKTFSAGGTPGKFEQRILLREANGEWRSTKEIKTFEEPKKSADDPALILFSSGTTSGIPKGVVLTHAAILKNLNAIKEYMNPRRNDIFLITKTMVHASTLTGEVFVAISIGAVQIVKNPVISPTAILKRISEYRPTIIAVNPTILRLLMSVKHLKLDLSSVRLLYTSGAVVEKEQLIKAEKLFSNAKVFNVYGLTEAGPRVSAQRIGDVALKYGSVGMPIAGVLVKIINKTGLECSINEIGMIYVKSPSLMKEYLNDPITTGQKIQNGWLITGDLGYVDDDGELFIMGRADDMIIRGSHNIDPYRIENIIKKLTNIYDCIVFGIPDSVNGNKIICAIQGHNWFNLKKEDLFRHCSKFLAPYECPQEICIWPKIPKTLSGKNSKKLAAEYYQDCKQKQ